ncbi:MAG: malate:quinone oxidoreductase, partial [Agromyces sp.]|nr:malate:quinone oxidoreductase [Agromyces sp.]
MPRRGMIRGQGHHLNASTLEIVTSEESVDVVLIGGGIMSATLGSLISQLEPDWSIRVYERLGEVAQESSNAWNNAGTGHAALCELNYMPEASDGTVDAAKAVSINEQFQVSRQYWAHLVSTGALPEPHNFINSTPHMTFVKGEANVEYLRKRVAA